MMFPMRVLPKIAAFLAFAVSPLAAFADDKEVYDGRLEGYSKPVTLPGGGTALLWMLLLFLAIIALGVLFKNAKRSHLD